MDAAFIAEQDETRRSLRALLAERCGPPEVRSAVQAAEGYDRALWQQLATGFGLAGLALPAAYGSAGRTTAERVPQQAVSAPPSLALAYEETGRVLLPSPLLATAALAAPLIAALGTEDQRLALLPPIAAGALTATLAVPGGSLCAALGLSGDNADGRWAGGGRAGGIQAVRATGGGGGWRLYGEAAEVLDGHSAGLLLVAAHTGGFPRSRALLFLVRADAATGLVRVRRTSLDETRPQDRIELRDAEAELLGSDDAARVAAALADCGRTVAAVLAAEAAGAAASVLERTVAYVRGRERGGAAAGSFQAVRHRLADLYVRVQSARSAAYYAAWDPVAGALALAQALEVLRVTAAEAAQLSGGSGLPLEREARRCFNRAAAGELLFGPGHRLREYAAQKAGLFTDGVREAVGQVAV